MKKIFILFMVLLIALSFTACGGSNTDPGTDADLEGAVTEQPVEAATKTLAYFNRYASGGAYTTEMKTSYGGVTATMLSVYDGGNIYSETEADGVKSRTILKDGAQYVLDDASKTCIKLSVETEAIQDIFTEEAETYEVPTAEGEIDIDGTTYYYEEFSLEGESVKYCFDGNELKFILMSFSGEESRVEILSMEKGADNTLFEIPEDYNLIEY